MRALITRRVGGRRSDRVVPASLTTESGAGATESVDPIAAAVLVPLVDRLDGLSVLLTQRTAHLRDHAGQISFPGGRIEDHDADPIATALRETEEEIGLSRGHIDIIGCLDAYMTGTGFHVVPVVGFVNPPFELTLDAFEVADAFEVPLDFVLDPENCERHSRNFPGRGRREFYVLPFEDRYIWGATARILIGLRDVLLDRDSAAT